MTTSTLLTPGSASAVDGALPPTLIVVVDTEEEFDWARPHDRASTGVEAMSEVGQAQSIFDNVGARPCYVVDYPVATQAHGFRHLVEIMERGGCSVGAHLHPWVNPPHEEVVCSRNSFPGNLPPELERAKLESLCGAIERFSGTAPTVYKAGRYGVGRNTDGILDALGFSIDLSPTPAFSYRVEGGPDFTRHSNHPYWFGPGGQMLCIPCTGEVVGLLGSAGRAAHRLASGTAASTFRAGGVLARLRLAERIRLSPEGFTLEEMKRLARYLLARGTRILTLSYHSPSLKPGCTPYVRNDGELRELCGRIDGFLRFFLEEVGGVLSEPMTVLDQLRNARGAAA